MAGEGYTSQLCKCNDFNENELFGVDSRCCQFRLSRLDSLSAFVPLSARNDPQRFRLFDRQPFIL
jgi:hypothetical protein